jgi:hypothetical protein
MIDRTGHHHYQENNKQKEDCCLFVSDFYEQKIMTDSSKVFNIYSTEPTSSDPPEDTGTFGEVKRANASK